MTRNRSPEQQQAHDDWVRRAGEVDIVQAAVRLGAKLKKSNGAWAWRGPCPAAGCGGNDRFSLNVKKRIYNCRGCGQGGDVISMTMAIGGLSFLQACEELTGEPPPNGPAKPLSEAEKAERNRRRQQNEEAQRMRQAQEAAREEDTKEYCARIWGECAPIAGTLAEKYLQLFHLPVPPGGWPGCLGYHPALAYPGKGKMPALVARVDDVAGQITGIWREFIRADGRKADVEFQKLGLGPVAGGAVRLGGVNERVGCAEGVRTALGAWALIGFKYPVWSCLSTSGLIGFEAPLGVERVVIWPDGDRPMKKQGEEFVPAVPAGRKAAVAMRARMISVGVGVTIAAEPGPARDYLDIWQEHARETA